MNDNLRATITRLDAHYRKNEEGYSQKQIQQKWITKVGQWTEDYGVKKADLVNAIIETTQSVPLKPEMFGLKAKAQAAKTKGKPDKPRKLTCRELDMLMKKADNLFCKQLVQRERAVLWHLITQVRRCENELTASTSARTYETRYKDGSKETYQRAIAGLLKKGVIGWKTKSKDKASKSVFILFPTVKL